jgi:hypothetical protein
MVMTTSAYGVLRSGTASRPVPAEQPVAHAVALGRRRQPLVATAASILAALLLGFVSYVAGVGTVIHARAQQLAYAQLREQLANATAPLGQVDEHGSPLAPGTPVALFEGPGIREVVREGTTSSVLTGGPGHRRDTPLPGQPGTSIVYGRRAAFGGPFAGIATWHAGDRFTVTTAQGRHAYRVVDVRAATDPLPPPAVSRVTLLTATGPSFAPSGVVRVDADLTSAVAPMAPLRPAALSRAERPLAGDTDALGGLVLWGLALVLAACVVVWMAARWGRRQSWLVGVPVLGALGLAVASSVAQLLPNLT